MTFAPLLPSQARVPAVGRAPKLAMSSVPLMQRYAAINARTIGFRHHRVCPGPFSARELGVSSVRPPRKCSRHALARVREGLLLPRCNQ